jgi:hypothetical protein
MSSMNPSIDADPSPISRREVILRVSALLGGAAFVGGSGLLAAVEKAALASDGAPGSFTADDIALLDEIAETILPATKTPGAKAAKTGAFMARMVTDCYSAAEQQIFRDGMRQLNDRSRNANNASFMEATPQQRLVVLTTLDQEQKRVMDAREMKTGEAAADVKQPAHYFRMMKELALLGYFTSEVGCTEALRYVEVPGRFDPCIPYSPGQPAWAAHA